MNSKSRQLRHETGRQSEHQQQSLAAHKQTVREFGSVEELLRHDAGQVLVPPHIAAKVQESIAQEPTAPRGWWQRLLGR